MNKITKRIVASLSAAALIVSTFGSNSFSGTMMDSVYAEESATTTTNRKGKSTGFENLEQDTNADGYYNTGYGLHTNKTATEVNDGTGRTFDVNLESWYVGENPVDVATILDASGSMAWTVDTLDPLEVTNIEEISEICEIDDYDGNGTQDINDIIAWQNENDGYLPQEAVDLILDKTKTDDSKLSYSKYKYYVYEARSSVSEFVPLGYWDGYTGRVTRDDEESLKGFYDFNDKENGRFKNLKSSSGEMQKVVEVDGGTPGVSGGNNYPSSSGDEAAVQIGKTRYTGNTTISGYKGMKLDVSPTVKEDKSFEFTLSFALKGSKDSGIKNWDIFRIQGDGKTDCVIRVPTNKGNGLAARYFNEDDTNPDQDHGSTNGNEKIFGSTYAFYSFVFYNNEGTLYYQLYKNGNAVTSNTSSLGEFKNYIDTNNKIDIIFDPSQFNDTTKGNNIFVDDIYFFDKALSADEVNNYFGDGDGELCEATTYKDGKVNTAVYHAKIQNKDGTIYDLAQISNSLYKNSSDEERRGWYYVNSHSNWNDISGCLKSGKQYVGIVKENDDIENEGENGGYSHADTATVPGSYEKTVFDGGNDQHDEYEAPDNERSIRFYVDAQSHLRCFAHAGGTSKEKDPRTFCSVVYEKGYNDDETEQITKYEALNAALNGFYEQLAVDSDLSNSAVVRFSTHNLMEEDADKHLKSLIIKDWTNWSDYYRDLTEDQKSDKTIEQLKKGYMNDLLIPAEGETSLPDSGTEYPYVMTGGTYTWTGLKAFYDNMVDTTDKTSGNTVYDIANDARDKYLIIFTDGRDNLVGDTKTNYVEGNKPEGSSGITQESQLAKAWADKLKDEGYTIFCVMMAAGSISPTANPDEYEKAKTFVTSLAGEKANDENAASYVTVIGAGAGEGSVNNVSDAFDKILKQIQQPRNDYTVQDYIDPRFDLVDANGNLYKLGAGGVITNADGTVIKTVGNVIDKLDDPDITADKCKEIGLPYTPIDSYMVNREATTDTEKFPDGYTKGDGKGTGYIYYDDVKDMYYLRWTDQIIPMENEAFDTTDSEGKTLDVWSATIRLKAKDDFIGGNNILTNGNEAGENLVYSEATIENMDKGTNYNLYGLEKDSTYREKLAVLSGTDRKINAVDAGGVSQAVYGDGIDIPSSGFPRTTVNVRLLPLNANNLNDVIYMGEVVSPTMMLADLENGYMTGSYYLEYLERYAYRVYGESADQMPLIELLNEWLKIKDTTVTDKTFTIPYIYLPDPQYGEDGKLATDDDGNVIIKNSTGWNSELKGETDFADLNLRDVTGFITYTWKREYKTDEEHEPQQEVDGKNDITKEYVVKNTNQIKYNLQLKFTPLTEGELKGFSLDNEKFIIDEFGKPIDQFFKIDTKSEKTDDTFYEFIDEVDDEPISEWEFTKRSDYLKAMVQEKRIYEPHVMYNDGKWVLVDDDGSDKFTSEKARAAYTEDEQTTDNGDNKSVKDSGVYDWDTIYKSVAGKSQIEGGMLDEYYTDTLHNVGFADKDGVTITDESGGFIEGKVEKDVCSLVANTTYTKDVVNGALALELVVDGQYLSKTDSKINKDKKYTFIATRYYDDPYDPLPYGEKGTINADTGGMDGEKVQGKKYRLTFKVKEDTLPENPKDNEFYTVWAELESVEVEVADSTWESINEKTSENKYVGYTDMDALPIGTYEIHVDDSDMKQEQYLIGGEGTAAKYFTYLKIDNAPASFTYDRFPESVYKVSDTAKVSTGDGEYLIWDESTDNASKNIAGNDRVNDSAAKTQTLTFYFGTVKERDINGKPLSNTVGYSRKTEGEENDYAKDRLGIILLTADLNNLFISKEVTHTISKDDKTRPWEFTVTFEPNPGTDTTSEFKAKNDSDGFKLKWFTRENSDSEWEEQTDLTGYPGSGGGTTEEYPKTIKFVDPDGDGKYTATIYLKHNEKVLIDDLPSGTWQVTEKDVRDQILYSAHNDMDKVDEYSWSNKTDECPSLPGTGVEFTNQFPHYVFSAGGAGTYLYILCGGLLLLMASVLYYLSRLRKSKSRDKPDG